MNSLPLKTIERLIVYKRLLTNLENQGKNSCFSHELAQLANSSAVQVRRDLMLAGFSGGSSGRGYSITHLRDTINGILQHGHPQQAVLVGIGNLGRAILSFFSYRQPGIEISCAFDNSPEKTNRVISGCRCYPAEELYHRVSNRKIALGIITVPAVHAQQIANDLVDAGVRGILNFAPVALKVPTDVFVEELDIMMALEKLAYLIK